MELKNKTILVTGGGGFIGSHIVEDLVKEGAKVIVYDLKPWSESSLPSHLKGFGVEYIWGDIRDIGGLTEVFASFKPDMVCHQAALTSVPMSFVRPDEYFDTNVVGTQNVFNIAKNCGVEKIVYASSCAVYDSASPYAYNKSMNEELANLYRKLYKMNIVGLRYFNVYGPRQTYQSEGAVIPALIKGIKNNDVVIYGNGTQTRDFVFVRDVAAANVCALKHEGSQPIFEVGLGEQTSINEIYDYLCVVMEGGVKPTYLEARKGDIKSSCAYSSGTTMGLLNWNPQFNMTKGLTITCKAYNE